MPERRATPTPKASAAATSSSSGSVTTNNNLRRYIVCVLTAAIGLSSLIGTPYVARHDVKPVLKACGSNLGKDQVELVPQGFHKYEPRLGGNNVACLATQFLHRLLYVNEDNVKGEPGTATKEDTSNEAGAGTRHRLLGCGAFLIKVSLLLPAYALLSAESSLRHHHDSPNADRGGRRGFVSHWLRTEMGRPWFRRPALVLVLAQLVGVSAAFALVWPFSYVLSKPSPPEMSEPRPRGQGRDSAAAVLKSQRRKVRAANATTATLVGFAVACGAVLALPLSSRQWTVMAAIVGGPALALIPMVLNVLVVELPSFVENWFKSTQAAPGPNAATSPAEDAWIRCYGASGAIAFCLWSIVLFGAFSTYAIHYQALWNDILTSNGFVHRELWDAAALYMGLLLCVSYRSLWTALEALLQSVVFGPGAAVAMALAQLENTRRGTGGAAQAATTRTPIVAGAKKKIS